MTQFCVYCSEPIYGQRQRITNSCHDCGEQLAQEEIRRKELRTVPLFNKGGYQYAGNDKQTLEAVQNNHKAQRGDNLADQLPKPNVIAEGNQSGQVYSEGAPTGRRLPPFRLELDHFEGPPGKRMVVYRRIPQSPDAREALERGVESRFERVSYQPELRRRPR